MSHVVGKLELALEQQDRKAQTLIGLRFLLFWSSAKPSEAIPVTQEDSSKDEQSAETVDEEDKSEAINVCPAVPEHELSDMTHNFSSECLIGEGSSGRVYRVGFRSGQVAAIKKLINNCLPDMEFLEQVSITSNIKHENVAPLLGYCVAGGRHFLAYEFAQNGTLHDILHGHRGTDSTKRVPALSWSQRVKIALGVAKGLEYLHQKKLIHQNIRSSNILLFDDYNVAKLSDFGWFTQSRPYSLDDDLTYYHPNAFNHPRGYHPSEYVWYEKLSSKTDVYSFGVLLLELLTDRDVNGDRDKPQHIVEWASPWLGEDIKVKRVVNARLNGNYSPKGVLKMAKVARMCVQDDDGVRPEMGVVIRALHSLLNATSASQ